MSFSPVTYTACALSAEPGVYSFLLCNCKGEALRQRPGGHTKISFFTRKEKEKEREKGKGKGKEREKEKEKGKGKEKEKKVLSICQFQLHKKPLCVFFQLVILT